MDELYWRAQEDRVVSFPRNAKTGEKGEDALPHLFDCWYFDKMPKFSHALRYIELRYAPDDAELVEAAMPGGSPHSGRCDDLLRTCRLYPAPLEDPLVREHQSHITSGKKFRPCVLVQFRDGRYQPDLIDGYHRVSVAWWWDAQMIVPIWRVII